jgi:hypothetical protein
LADIDRVLGKIEDVASNRDGIATEEALILRGYSFHFAVVVNIANGAITTALSPANWRHTGKP